GARAVERLGVFLELYRRRRTAFARGGALKKLQAESLRNMVEGFVADPEQVFVESLFLAVRKLAEELIGALDFGLRQAVAKVLEALGERVTPGVFAQHDVVRRHADRLGRDDFVSDRVLQNAVLVDAGLVRESVAPHDGLVALHGDAGEAGEQLARGIKLFGADIRVDRKGVAPEVNGHDNLFQRRVPSPFPDAVDRTFDLAR